MSKSKKMQELEKAIEGLMKKLRASEAITAAILEITGSVTVKRERLNEIVSGDMEAVVGYDAEKDEYTFAPAAE